LVHKPRVAVVVDSSSCLPRDIQEASGIKVVPHQLITDGRVYRDGIDISPSEFYRQQRLNGKTSTTSGPNPQAFLEAFQQAAKTTDSILCITLSPRFSATTYDSAITAARMALELQPNLTIEVLDSQAAAGAEGFIALEASRRASHEEELDQILADMRELIPRVHLLAFLDTLQYLGKSGKVSKVKAWAGSLLGFKPLTELSRGEARLLAKPRSRSKAMDQLLAIAIERMGSSPVHVNVMHANVPEDAQEMRRRAEESLNCREIFTSEFTPVMGAHTGPGLLGLAFYADL
jgi:DegV family protein with EDD domain